MQTTTTGLQCFDITLNGFYGGTDDTDDLVKWVAAPSEEAVRLFIQKHDLENIVQSGPTDMGDHRPGFDDGLDLLVNERGDVIRWRKGLNINWRRTWSEEAWPEKFDEGAYDSIDAADKAHKRMCKRHGRRRRR